jgi:hypothetical protein
VLERVRSRGLPARAAFYECALEASVGAGRWERMGTLLWDMTKQVWVSSANDAQHLYAAPDHRCASISAINSMYCLSGGARKGERCGTPNDHPSG